MNTTNLPALIDAHYDLASSEQFSLATFRALGEISIEMSLDEVKALYSDIKNTITSFSRHYDFVTQGLSKLTFSENQGATGFLLSANVCHRLNGILNDIQLDGPAWLPRVYRRESEGMNRHAFLYLFNWATVSPAAIPERHYNYFLLKLQEGSVVRSGSDRPDAKVGHVEKSAGASESPVVPDAKPKAAVVAKPSVSVPAVSTKPVSSLPASKDIHDPVEHGKYVASKYLKKMEDAQKRGLEFSLSIEEMSQLLRQRTCFYTGVDLVDYRQIGPWDGEVPKNYLTLDRKDSDKGYVSGNVVVCSHEINQMKDTMSAADFERTVSMKKLLETSGFSPEQMKAFASMVNLATAV